MSSSNSPTASPATSRRAGNRQRSMRKAHQRTSNRNTMLISGHGETRGSSSQLQSNNSLENAGRHSSIDNHVDSAATASGIANLQAKIHTLENDLQKWLWKIVGMFVCVWNLFLTFFLYERGANRFCSYDVRIEKCREELTRRTTRWIWSEPLMKSYRQFFFLELWRCLNFRVRFVLNLNATAVLFEDMQSRCKRQIDAAKRDVKMELEESQEMIQELTEQVHNLQQDAQREKQNAEKYSKNYLRIKNQAIII